MFDSKDKLTMNKKSSSNDGSAFFRMAEPDLSDSLPDNQTPLPTENYIPVKKAINSMLKHNFSFHSEYEKFKNKRDELTDIFISAADIMRRLNMHQLNQKISDMSERIKSDSFKIQIVGNFKNGKSTFINSFLGEDVLPAYALPCTAVINEVKYGIKKRAVIHFKNPLPKTLPSELSPVAQKHIQAYLPGIIPPLEVAYDKIEDYVVIPVGKDPKDMLLESPYERVELFWPLDLLKNGIELIDSPGLNEHTTRTKVTMDFLTKSDAIIFLLNATMLCQRDEMNFIEKSLHDNGFKDLFFVINRFDMIPDTEKNRIMQYAKKNLAPMTNFSEKGLFFVSAKNALKAKINNNETALNQSGMPDFEKSLSSFLTKKKGILKLMSPARAISNFLQEEALKKILPQQRKNLSAPAKEAENKCNSIRDKIEMLKRKKKIFANMINSDIEQLSCFFAPAAKVNINNTASSVSTWMQNFDSTENLGLTHTKIKVMSAIQELLEYIRLKIEESNREWCTNTILPLINKRKSAVFSAVNKQIVSLVRTYEVPEEDAFKRFNSRFIATVDTKEEVTYKTVEHITSAPLLELITTISSSDFEERAFKLFQKKSAWNLSATKLKNIVAEEVTQALATASNDFAESFVNEIVSYFYKVEEKVLSPIEAEISSLQNELDLLSAKIKMKKPDFTPLDKTEAEINQLCEHLNKYISLLKS